MTDSGLHRIESHEALLAATHGSPFVRWDVPRGLEGAAYGSGDAVAVPRRTHTRRLGLLVMGPPTDAGRLVAAMAADGVLPEDLRSVTVQRGSLDAVGAHLPLSDDGNEWEWLCTRSVPPVSDAERRLSDLSRDDLDDIRGLLADANPGTDARPFEHPHQQWVGAWDEDHVLLACGVLEPGVAGQPVLSGITVRAQARGTGLGAAVTGRLTRAAVEQDGVCTLGLYSHNDVARRVYLRLGYGDVHEWSSRRLVQRA